MPPNPTQKTLNPKDPNDFREKLPRSGVFEMLDCEVEIYCPELASTEDIQKMVNTIESMINVVDVRISSTPEKLHSETYQVIITEIEGETLRRLYKNRNEPKE